MPKAIWECITPTYSQSYLRGKEKEQKRRSGFVCITTAKWVVCLIPKSHVEVPELKRIQLKNRSSSYGIWKRSIHRGGLLGSMFWQVNLADKCKLENTNVLKFRRYYMNGCNRDHLANSHEHFNQVLSGQVPHLVRCFQPMMARNPIHTGSEHIIRGDNKYRNIDGQYLRSQTVRSYRMIWTHTHILHICRGANEALPDNAKV